MAKIVFLNNWFKKTVLPLFAFPFDSLFSADSATDMKYFLMYADKKAVSESAITTECIAVVSDEYAEQIENVLACVDYTENEKFLANGELNVCLISEDIPDEILSLPISKIEKICEAVVSYMTKDNDCMSIATEKTYNNIIY